MNEEQNTQQGPERASHDIERPSPLLRPEPEYEDEAPGAYIRELGVGSWNAIWAATNLIVGLAVALWNKSDTTDSVWQPLRQLLWILLPVSALSVLIITLWQSGSRYTGAAPRRALLAIALSVATFAVWIAMNSSFSVP